MQLGDNRAMQTYSNGSRRRLLVLGIGLLLIIGVVVAVAGGSKHQSGFAPAYQQQSPTYEGMSAFIDNGMTTEQVNNLIQAFSKFAPKAKVISIDTSSLTPGPHTPGTLNPFTIRFSLTVDSKPYNGVVSYSNLSSIRLYLYAASGRQVFDSGVIPALH